MIHQSDLAADASMKPQVSPKREIVLHNQGKYINKRFPAATSVKKELNYLEACH
jgi:hypothetical protein